MSSKRSLGMPPRSLSILIALILLSAIATFSLWRHWHRESPIHPLPRYTNKTQKAALPTGIALDGNGNLYVAVQKQNRILRISTNRRVTVAAGSGRIGFSGDGGPAVQACLDSPVSIALDRNGNLFVADTGNNRIRRVDARTKVISTVAGNGVRGGGVNEIATSAGLYEPISIAVDKDDNLYIGGTTPGPIRRVDAITHIVTMVIGAGLPGYTLATSPATGPFWVAVDENGTLLFSDPNRNVVSQFSALENKSHIVAGSAICGFAGDGGPANGALLCFPEALSVTKNRLLFIADTANNRIRQVDLNTGIITTVAGNGQPGYAGDGGPAINASLNGPMGIATDEQGNIYIADTGNNCIRRISSQTGTITTFASGDDFDVRNPGENDSTR